MQLTLEDTTSHNFTHASVSDDLGHTTPHKTSRGFHTHSILFSPHEQHVVGLIEQHRWARDVTTYGHNVQHAQRPYEEKGSFKWERAFRTMVERLGEQMSKVISVCDREADLIEYLAYKVEQKQRFVVRSMQSRCIEEDKDKLYSYGQKIATGRRTRCIRPAKRRPKSARGSVRNPLCPCDGENPGQQAGRLGSAVLCRLSGKRDSGRFMTPEPIKTSEEAMLVLDYYEKRWLIEDFHKA